MASDIGSASMTYKYEAPLPPSAEEIELLRAVIRIRNEIYDRKNSRQKEPVQPFSAVGRRNDPQKATDQSSDIVIDQTKRQPAATHATQIQPKPTTYPASAGNESRIDNVLLAKSDILIKAETSIRRQRIEKDLKHELDQRKMDNRLGLEVRDGYAVKEDEVDLEKTMEEAGIKLKQVVRPDDPASTNKLKGFFGDKTDEHKELDGISGEQRQAEHRDDRLDNPNLGQSRQPPQAHTSVMPRSTPNIEGSGQKGHVTSIASGPSSRDGRPSPRSQLRREVILPGTQLDRPDSRSPQPRFAAASQVRSPAAPQPLRPANMARVQSQDLIDVEDGAGGTYGAVHGRSPHSQRTRCSPQPFIKAEPLTPRLDDSRKGRSPLPRAMGSPEHVYRRSMYEAYDSHVAPYGSAPPPRDYYPPPPSLQPRHPYDPYVYREDLFAYPPHPEYRRPYAPGPYIRSSEYYAPPRPVYGDYGDGYPQRSIPPPDAKRSPPPRSSMSPPKRPNRRGSRSISPDRRAVVSPTRSPRPRSRTARPWSPSVAAVRDAAPYEAPPGPSHMPPRVSDPYPREYAPPVYPPRERIPYFDSRDPYGRLHVPRYVEEALMPRPESNMVPRDDYRGYRERDYPLPGGMRPPSGPPPPMGNHPYASRGEYSRAPSRAPMGPPPEANEYPPRRPHEYYTRPEMSEYVRAPPGLDERPNPPARHPSVRPEVADPYRDAGYRPGSARPPPGYPTPGYPPGDGDGGLY